ncbi:hypothetical protein SLS62_009304 [Diatrype stigma]|uniref:Uncharacterized protein n=1 Tax=Diatrype stigma TaxID=117547 RepID=A0AAN9YLD9_9PEZI
MDQDDTGGKYAQFKLQSFGLFDRHSGLTLSVESTGFISNFPASFLERETAGIYQLVQSGDLWLQSSGSSQLEITFILNGEPMASIGPETEFLEGMAEVICEYSETGLGESGDIDVDEEARRQDACLTDSALYVLFKIPRRRPGLKLLEFDKAPSVVDLAPAVWNAHYAQGANTSQGSSESNRAGQTIIQHRLWKLVQTTLKPRTGTEKCPKELFNPGYSNWEAIEPNPPPLAQEPDDGAPFGGSNDSQHFQPEDPFSSDWALPQFSINDYPGHGDDTYPANDRSRQYEIAGAGYSPGYNQQYTDDEVRELNDENMLDLGDESLDLPYYHTEKQDLLQQPWNHYQHQLSSETMSLDPRLTLESSEMRQVLEQDAMDVNLMPTSETLALGGDD